MRKLGRPPRLICRVPFFLSFLLLFFFFFSRRRPPPPLVCAQGKTKVPKFDAVCWGVTPAFDHFFKPFELVTRKEKERLFEIIFLSSLSHLSVTVDGDWTCRSASGKKKIVKVEREKNHFPLANSAVEPLSSSLSHLNSLSQRLDSTFTVLSRRLSSAMSMKVSSPDGVKVRSPRCCREIERIPVSSFGDG